MSWRLIGTVAALAGLLMPGLAQGVETPTLRGRVGPVEALAIEVAGEQRPFTAVEIVGLRQIEEDALWAAIGRPAAPFAFAEAAALLRSLDGLGAFARVDPLIRVGSEQELSLVVRVREQPRLQAIEVRGARETDEGDLIADLLGEGIARPGWFARVDGGRLQPGLLHGGLERAVRRAMRGLLSRGFLMTRMSGALAGDGTLTLDLDEGRLGEIRLVGPHPSLHRAVLRALDLEPGRTLYEPELADAVQRVQKELPILKASLEPHPTRAEPSVTITERDGGGQAFALQELPAEMRAGFFGVEGDRLVLYFERKTAVRFRFLADELLRHTPVGGIGVGLHGELRVFDPRNRVHAGLDFFSGTVDGDALKAAGQDAGEFASALRLQAPRWWNAEISLEAHSMIDSSDTWRTSRQTSYLNSLLFDRADSEFYWREGGTIGVTVQPTERLLLGLDHRYDRYTSMASLGNPASIFEPENPFVNPPIQQGEMGSLLLRAELRSTETRPDQVRSLFRAAESPAAIPPQRWGLRSGYALFASLEVARPGLGSDADLCFTRFVSDNRVMLATGRDSGLGLRARIAGGSTLPLQKEESLGGWSALRGYGFKEFRGGDWSLLGVAEYRHHWLSGFVDVGALRRKDGAGWSGPHPGAGLKLHPDSLPLVGRWLRRQRLVPPIEIGLAWRLDHPKAEPSVRILVGSFF